MSKIRKLYSQAGQDLWVMRDVFDYKTSGFFIDIGAYDGVHLSNTYWLEKNLGWQGICVEADPKTFSLLRKNRNCKCLNACVGASNQKVSFLSGKGPYSGALETCLGAETKKISGGESLILETSSLKDILKICNAPSVIDYLSVDVEGMEEEVMSSFPFNDARFLCATIERPNKAVRMMLQDQGYLLVADQPGLDAFYLHPQMQDEYRDRILKRSEYFLNPPIGKRIVNRTLLLIKYLYRHGLRSALRRI